MSGLRGSPRTLRLAAAAALCVALAGGAAGCASDAASTTSSGSPPAAAAPAAPPTLPVEGTLAVPQGQQVPPAVTYNPEIAPTDARVQLVLDQSAPERTTVSLAVDGLVGNRSYAVHIHARQCGLSGADAGPHYQHTIDPAAGPQNPSVDPAFANPQNEVWLDVSTDDAGRGNSQAQVPFGFTERPPGSVVIHEAARTATEPGKAGSAGNRVACITIPPPAPGS